MAFRLIASGVGKGQRVGEVEPVHVVLYWSVSSSHHRQVEMQKLPGRRPHQGVEKINRIAGCRDRTLQCLVDAESVEIFRLDAWRDDLGRIRSGVFFIPGATRRCISTELRDQVFTAGIDQRTGKRQVDRLRHVIAAISAQRIDQLPGFMDIDHRVAKILVMGGGGSTEWGVQGRRTAVARQGAANLGHRAGLVLGLDGADQRVGNKRRDTACKGEGAPAQAVPA